MLDYRYETFLSLVETKSYTKTAKQINFTQPAVTKHIQYIEKELGTTLVIFKDRQLIITNEGQYLYEKIKFLQQEIVGIKQEMLNQISLKIGASKTIGEYYLPKRLESFNQTFEKAEVSLMVDNTSTLLKQLDRRKIDLALVSGPVQQPGFVKDVFYTDDIVLFCSNNHHLAGKTIKLADLFSETMVARESESGLSESLNEQLHQLNYRLSDFQHVQRVGNINLIKHLVKQNEGLSFSYRTSIQQDLTEGRFSTVTMTDFSPQQDFYVVRQNEQELNQATRYFIDRLK